MGYGDSSRSGSGWRLAAWGVLTLFMMGWAFFLGLLVGQGSLATPEQLEALKDASHAVPGLGLLAREEPPPPPQEPQPRDLTFYREVERKAEGTSTPTSSQTTVTSTVSTATTGSTLSTTTTLVAKAPTSSVTTTTNPAQRFVPQPYVPPAGWVPPPRPATPNPSVPASPPPSASGAPTSSSPAGVAPPTAAKGRFTVQVASFKDEEPARELLAQLKSAGHPAYLVSASVEGVGTRFRVRVGPFNELEAAQGAAARIRMQLLLAAYVTRD